MTFVRHPDSISFSAGLFGITKPIFVRSSVTATHFWLTFAAVVTLSVSTTVITVFASNFYVSSTGSDSNPGTIDMPWQTFQKAINTVNGGETVHFRAGVYPGGRFVNKHPPAEQWIIFKPYGGEKVIVNTAGGKSVRISGGSYLIIDGFEITNLSYNHSLPYSCELLNDPGETCRAKARALAGEPSTETGIAVDSTYFRNANTDTHHIIIQNNHIHHNLSYGIMAGTGANTNGLYPDSVGNYNFQILNNHIHHNGYGGLTEGYGTYITGTNFTVRGNILHDNSGNNMRIGNISKNNHANDWIIEDNISYNNRGPFLHSSGNITHGYAFVLYGIEGSIFRNNVAYGSSSVGLWSVNVSPSKPTLIYNNTFYGNDAQGMQLSGNSIAKNNIVYKNAQRIPTHEVEITPSGTGSFEHNLVGGNCRLISVHGSSRESNNIKNVNPLFVNPEGGDFHLLSGSPAIDNGLPLAEVTDDFDQNKRPLGSAYDIGAFEFSTTPSPNSPPDRGSANQGGEIPADLHLIP